MVFKRVRFPDGEKVIAIAFDICSSSDMIEGLTARQDVGRYAHMIGRIKNRLAKLQEKILFDPYKFTGDGWILLFPRSTSGRLLLRFMRQLSKFCKSELKKVTQHLDAPPMVIGINFGIDFGPIFRMKIFQVDEYVGRPINVACRLQSAIKDKDRSPAYKALVSRTAYFGHLSQRKGTLRVQNVRRTLRNINGNKPINCLKIRVI